MPRYILVPDGTNICIRYNCQDPTEAARREADRCGRIVRVYRADDRVMSAWPGWCKS